MSIKTETYYRVTFSPGMRFTSRLEAEQALASRNIPSETVERVTEQVEYMGPQWVQAATYHFPWETLYDGDTPTDWIVGNHDGTGPKLYHHVGHGAGKGVPYPTVEEAKEAAVVALKATWT